MSSFEKGSLGNLKYLLSGQRVASGAFDPNQSKRAKQDRYYSLMRGINMYSFSTSGALVACPRKLALNKLEQAASYERNAAPFSTLDGNMDFAFGKAFETGVQGYFLGKSESEIFFDTFMSWDLPLFQLHPKEHHKTFTDVWIMLERFKWIFNEHFKDWELAYFNGKPAIELAFLIELGNGYYYAGHADVIMVHKIDRTYRVLEIKTTNRKWIHPAMYKNSDQAVGYSVVLDSIAKDLETTATFEVFYLICMSEMQKFEILPFTKSRSNRAAWLNTILLDTHTIDLYRKTGIFPKRGASCFDYMKPCQYFDTCDMSFDNFKPDGEFALLSAEEIEQHSFDFRFHLKDIIETQEDLL